MSLRLITPATELAVSLSEAKEHLRVDSNHEDTIITAMIEAATEMSEQKTGRSIMLQTWELTLDAFPDAFEITGIPLASITSVRYADTTGDMQTLDAAGYAMDNTDDYGPAYIVPAHGTTWPSTRDQINAVAVRYVSGYANAAAVPASIKAWIKLTVGAMHANRESEAVGNIGLVTLGFADRLLDRSKVWGV